MSFFSRLFKIRKSEGNETEFSHEADAICAFERKVNKLLSADKFISRKDYIPVVNEYSSLYSRLDILQESGTLAFFATVETYSTREPSRSWNFMKIWRIRTALQKSPRIMKSSSADIWFLTRHILTISLKRPILQSVLMSSSGALSFLMKTIL